MYMHTYYATSLLHYSNEGAFDNVSLIAIHEFILKIFHYLWVQLECLAKKIRIDRRIGSKDRVGYGDDTRILAAQTGKGNRICFSNVELEVNHANRKHKNISLVQNFCNECVIELV